MYNPNHPQQGQQQPAYGQQYGQQYPQQYGPQYGPMPYLKKKSPLPWIIGLVIGIPVLGVIGLVGLGLMFNASATESTPTAAEINAVMTVDDLVPYVEDVTPNKSLEKKTKYTYIDDSYEIEYEYDGTELYVYSVCTVEPTADDASMTYSAQNFGTSMGNSMANEDIEIDERNDIYKWGDESKFAILKQNGEPYGNLFTCRKGKKVLYIIWGGVYFDQKPYARDLLDPIVKRFEAHN